jgi:hypothetical protein
VASPGCSCSSALIALRSTARSVRVLDAWSFRRRISALASRLLVG